MTRRIALSPFTLSALLVLGAGPACKGADAPPAAEAGPAGAEGPADVVVLTEEAMRLNGLRVAEVDRRNMSEWVDAPAEVRLSPDREAHVAPLVAGQIRRVDVSIGDRVRAGDTLAVLRSVELGQARADLQRARALLDSAGANFARQKKLRADGIASERSFLEAKVAVAEAKADHEAALARLRVFGVSGGTGPDMPITAPIDGTVLGRHATRGENVGTDRQLFEVGDPSRVWAVAQVYEHDMDKVKPGAAVRLTVQGQKDRTWDGTLTYVAPVLDERTRTLTVRAEFDNDDGALRPGVFGRLHVAVGEPAPATVVPEDAVQTLRGEAVVFVPTGHPGSFRAQAVTPGRRDGALLEIREGLPAGARVVVEGAFLLKSQLLSGEFGEED